MFEKKKSILSITFPEKINNTRRIYLKNTRLLIYFHKTQKHPSFIKEKKKVYIQAFSLWLFLVKVIFGI